MDYSIDSSIESEELKALFYHDSCDANDYFLAGACGLIAGLVDVFLVGDPTDSKLLK